MALTNKIAIFLLFIIFNTNIKAKTVEQFFIKITPNQELVNCGKLKVNKAKTKLDYFIKDNKVDIIKPEDALQWINDSISKKYNSESEVLFYIHGFWGSLPFTTHRTSKEFKASYFKDPNSKFVAIIHIFWLSNDIAYKNSIISIQNSSKTLSEIFNQSNNYLHFKQSLMCHSMGNRFLNRTLSTQKVDLKLEHLILMAPDLDYRKFEENHQLFSNIAKTVDVFYHQKDQTLNMSKGINKIERLGRLNKERLSEKINFIDCTNISDIKTLSDSMMKHLYFLTSKTVKNQIDKILNQG